MANIIRVELRYRMRYNKNWRVDYSNGSVKYFDDETPEITKFIENTEGVKVENVMEFGRPVRTIFRIF